MITILLVDQLLECEGSIRRLMSQSTMNNFQLYSATGYRAVLEAFRNQAADVCVIDSTAGNEMKLLAQARSIGSPMPIVVVTGNDASEVISTMQNGAADCLIRDGLTIARVERSLCCVVEQARTAALQLQSNRRYGALCDNAETIIYTHDLDNNLTSMNVAGLQLLGYAEAEILGLKVSAIVDPTCQSFVSNMVEALVDAQRRTINNLQLATKSGNSLTVEMNAHPIYKQGKPIEIQVLARPIASPKPLHFYPGRRGNFAYAPQALPSRQQLEA